MKYQLKSLFVAVFIISFALGTRAMAIHFENDAISGTGFLLTALLVSVSLTMLHVHPRRVILAGATTSFMMCLADSIERTFHSPSFAYLWRNPIQAQYMADPVVLTIAIIIFTALGTLCGYVGVIVGTLLNWLIPKIA